MLITCPHCSFSKDIDEASIPANTIKARCLECGNTFPFTLARPARPAEKTVFDTAPPRTKPYTPPTTLPPLPGTAPGADGTELNTKIKFSGSGMSLFGLYFKMYFLAILTLGIYYFWGKTKLRHYVYGQCELLKERFTYTGTGRELWVGSIKASILMAIFFLLPQNLSEVVHWSFLIVPYFAMLFITPLAIVGSKRYRLSRTRWHGVNFLFTGSVKECLKIFIPATLLNFLTLGIYYPFYHVKMQKFIRENSSYGSASFKYDGRGGDMLFSFILMVFIALSSFFAVIFVMLFFLTASTPSWDMRFAIAIGMIPVAILVSFITLIPSWLWFKAKSLRYDWAHTTFDGLRFNSTVTAKKLILFTLANTIIIVCTLGIAYPWVVKRKIEFNFDNLEITGNVDFDRIRQSKQTASATGEGLLESFDMDVGYGI